RYMMRYAAYAPVQRSVGRIRPIVEDDAGRHDNNARSQCRIETSREPEADQRTSPRIDQLSGRGFRTFRSATADRYAPTQKTRDPRFRGQAHDNTDRLVKNQTQPCGC